MKKSLANQIANLWNERLAGGYEPTKTYAETRKEGNGDYCVEIYPCSENDGRSFHHHKELADIEGVFGVHAFTKIGKDNKLFTRIF
jgi:hypothetical protein